MTLSTILLVWLVGFALIALAWWKRRGVDALLLLLPSGMLLSQVFVRA